MHLLIQVFFFVLICFGMTNILAYGSIFNRIRPKHHFFSCPMCIGFWVGVLLSFFPNLFFSFPIDGVTQFMSGSISSGTSYILCNLFNDDGLQIKIRREK
jgi:hypothetical protein